jgi:hypothetical protein
MAFSEPQTHQSTDSNNHSRNQSSNNGFAQNDDPPKFKFSSSITADEMNKIPEPLDIMPKSMRMHDEQIKTGAQISFLNLERFLAGRQNELEKLA